MHQKIENPHKSTAKRLTKIHFSILFGLYRESFFLTEKIGIEERIGRRMI
jgi:hypothetical protein